MDYSVVFAFTMLALGLALIVAELFIPSGGVISLLSAACLGAAIYSAHSAWWSESPNSFWWFIGTIIGLIPATVGMALVALSRTRLGNRVLLEAPKLEEVTPYIQESEERRRLIGQTGKTLTLMAPGGLVLVGGTRHHAEAEGQMLDPDQSVKVVAVKGNRIVVRPYEPAEEEPKPPAPAAGEKGHPGNDTSTAGLAETTGDAGQSPLDFDIPDS